MNSRNVSLNAFAAWKVRTGPACGPASTAAWIISLIKLIVSSCVRSDTVLFLFLLLPVEEDEDEDVDEVTFSILLFLFNAAVVGLIFDGWETNDVEF